MKKLYIVGAGGFGREVLWLARRMNEKESIWDIQGFIDDNPEIQNSEQDDYPVLGTTDYLKNSQEEAWVVVAIGSAKVKKKVVEKISSYTNVHFATLIDPSVIMSDRVQIGEGCIICAGTILTVDIKIGNHVIINLDCTVGHDDIIEDYVTVYPSVNISGNVIVGQESELGTGMQVIQGKSIKSNTIIGAGAVVVKDIVEAGTYMGAPAKMKRALTEEKTSGGGTQK